MNRMIQGSLLFGCTLFGCSQEAMQEQRQARHERQEQRTRESAQRSLEGQREDTAAAREAAQREMAQARRGVQHDVAEARREVDQEVTQARREVQEQVAEHRQDAEEARRDVRSESQDLAALVSKACPGITEAEQRRCPIAGRSIESIEDVRNGVMVRLAANAGTKDAVEQRVECHQARVELDRAENVAAARPAGAPELTCLLDVRGADAEVSERAGRVSVSVTTGDDTHRQEIRTLARRDVPNAPPLRTTSGRIRRRDRP